jgi:trans-aconitate 2-methyltransferase
MHKWNPAGWEEIASAQYVWAMTLISDLHFQGDERVLDIGCGNGKITSKIVSLVPAGTVLGIDLSKDMINFAKSRYPQKCYANLSFEHGDARYLDFCEEFDLVVSFACLHLVRDHLNVLERVKRSLKPGGRLLFQCGGKGNAADILNVTKDLTRSNKYIGYFHGFDFPYYFYEPKDYRSWLRIVDLKPLRVNLVPKDMVHIGNEGLEKFIRYTWLPYLERLPDDLQPDFVSEIASEYISRYPLDSEGMVHVRMVRLEVAAEKPVQEYES